MTPEQIAVFADRLQQIRAQLFSESGPLEPEAEQHAHAAMGAIACAVAHLRLAKICSMQGR